jgi:hypothetical protein
LATALENEGLLMKTKSKKLALISYLTILIGIFSISTVLAQGDGITRTPDGKPDFSGIWQALTSAHYNIEPHAAEGGPHPGLFGALSAVPAGLGIVEGGQIPYNEQSRRQRDANRATALENDPLAKCYMPGVPRANYLPFPFQIVQSRDVILVAYEFAEANRIMYVDQPDLQSQVDAWMGHSNAHWEGDTLVVEVTGQIPDSWFDRAGNFHSFQMQVEERWTPAGSNVIMYEATITDPNVFTRPWKVSFPLYKRLEANLQLLEFKCAEFAEEYLYGEWRKEGTPIGNPPQ